MHEDPLVHLLIETTHILHDHQHLFIFRASQVLPVPIERCDSVRLELLGVVTEADFIIDAISAKRVLARLLQVDNHSNVEREHLRNDLELLNEACARPLRAHDFIHDKVRVEATDGYLTLGLLPKFL